MGISVMWDNAEQMVIRYIFEGVWTWDDMSQAVVDSNALLDAAGQKVDFIYDMRASAGVPSGAITFVKRYIGKEHPRTGRQLVVGASKSGMMLFARRLLGMMETVYRPRWGLQFADSLEAARDMLAKS